MSSVSLFDILDCLPRTDCGSCPSGNCTEFARKLQAGEAAVGDCRRLKEGGYEEERAELRELMGEE